MFFAKKLMKGRLIMNKKKLIAAVTSAVCFVGNFAVVPQIAGMQTYAFEAVNNNFEAGYEGWYANSETAVLTAVDGAGFNNSCGMTVTGRTSSEVGAASSKGFYLWGGTKYDYSVQVKADTDEVFHLSLMYKDEKTEKASTIELADVKAKAGQWSELSASFKAPGNTYEYLLTITTDSNNDFSFDDVVITTKEKVSADAAVAGKGLKDEFANYGFRVGNILNGGTIKNSAITAMIIQNYNSITCENETKPDATLNQAQCSGTNIGVKLNGATAIFDFCQKNNIAVRGHAFVWHSQTPSWFLKENYNGNSNWVTPAVMDQRLESYIKNMFSAIETQYPNLHLYAYDVCNECVSDDSKRTSGNQDGHREAGDNNVEGGKSAWVSVYGDNSFIEKAFTYARRYAPEGCSLFYNDYNEYWDHKRDCILRTIVKPLYAKGLLDGMGMQSHVPANATGFAGTDSYLQAMDMYLNVGCQVQVTELDISTEKGKYSFDDQAKKYNAIFTHVKDWNSNHLDTSNRVTALCIWGPNDANTWIKSENQPLLHDGSNQPKPAYTQVAAIVPDNQWGDGTNYKYDVGGSSGPAPVEPNEYGWYYQHTYEDGTNSWTARGGNSVAQSGNEHYTEWGSNSLHVTNRTETWMGAIYKLDTRAFKAGETYSFSAHVKQKSGENVKFMMKIEYTDGSGETAYDEVAAVIAHNNTWAQLVNTEYTIPADASDVKIYVETEESLTDFYMDEAIGAVGGTSIQGEGQPEISTNPNAVIIGDTDLDGRISAFDMVNARKAVVGKITDAAVLKAADVDRSGKIEVNDLVLLQKYLLGMIREFPNNRPPVDTAAMEAVFKNINISESWKNEGENNVLWTQRFGADPGFMVYKDRMYVFTTNDAFEYENGQMKENSYNVQTINCFSSADLVNWTDHGAIPVAGRNNGVGAAKWASFSWAPDAAWKTINGKDKFFLYFADSAGGIGVLTADRPEGPYRDELGHALITKSTPGYGEVTWLFDPAVLVDDDGTGYLYVGGGVPDGKQADPGTARAIKLGDDMMSLSGSCVKMNPPYLFEDSSIIKADGKYYYSYCTNWDTGGNPYGFANAEIGVMVSDNPLGPFTYKGIALKNPASYQLDGGGNNHHSIVEFKGKYYVLYHSRVIERRMGVNGGNGFNYRSCHIDNASFTNGMFSASGTMKGVSQIEALDPYTTVQAETMSNQSKEISTSGLCDTKVVGKKGEWIKASGVNFKNGTDSLIIKASSSDGGAVKVCTGSPTGDVIGYAELTSSMETISVPAVTSMTGTKDVYFVFSGDVEFDSWSVK